MKILKILIYILSVPVFLYLALFFEYLSSFSLILVFSVFFFRDLKKVNLWWILLLTSVLLDISMHFWIGTYFLSISIALLLLLLFDRLVSNFFLEIFAVFFVFLLFRFLFQTFIFFQETSALPVLDFELLKEILFFAVKNIFVYLLLKTGGYFFKSYFRENTF